MEVQPPFPPVEEAARAVAGLIVTRFRDRLRSRGAKGLTKKDAKSILPEIEETIKTMLSARDETQKKKK